MDFNSDPFDPFRMFNRLNKHFADMGSSLNKFSSNSKEPLVDISETEKEIKIIVEMPGLDKKNIDLRVKDNYLTIKATLKENQNKEEEDMVYQERSYQQFYRTIPLPENADSSNINAKYNNGILEITMPKKKGKTNPDRIMIE